ncbi:MAG: hypothetical protein KAI95_11580 [Bacteroidales bacterium]|nr:hypothetical protein [Bacteroidales bacterium]
MERREFVKYSALGTGTVLFPAILGCNRVPISLQQKPLAIAMWDFSWILRHHRYGEFENWDRVLEGLADRGYNAIRMDAMPQLLASDSDGKIIEEYRSVKDGWTPSLWGNDYTTTIRPREALLEFLPKCKKYGISVGLATWFMEHGTGRKGIFSEEGGLLRAWKETLTFLDQHELLKNVIYVDLLNEYPFWHGYDWLKEGLDERRDIKLQKLFYNEFITSLIKTLRSDYPQLNFYASLDSGMPLSDIDISQFSAIDYHIWFAHHGTIPGLEQISARDQKLDLGSIYNNLLAHWKDNKENLIAWMDDRLATISGMASKHQIPCGNTEGWGPIFWYDHPELDWKWVKEAAEVSI